tara:strand:+ start:819 stop:1709 length:891 start_codon:yes stop_codon:yes gene_type:complete
MSKIKVDTIQSTQHATSTIGLTSTGATINGDCSATTFTGSGANLTNVPAPSTYDAANLTGTLPAIDGSALTGISSGVTVQEEGSSLSTAGTTLNFVGAGVTASGTGASKTITVPGGGGSLEFVDKLETSTAVTSLTKTGLEYDKLYRISIPEIVYSTGTFLDIAPIVDNNTTPANANDCSYVNHVGVTGRGSSSYQGSQSYWRVDMGGWQTGPYGAFFDVYTSDKAYIMGHYVVLSSGIIQYQHGCIYGTKSLQNNTENDPNQTGSYAKVNGFKIYNANGFNINSGRILIHKYKES